MKPFLPPDKTFKKSLLDGATGVLRPGRMTLLLGPPGAGKTTLLRTLSGQMQKVHGVSVTGDFTFNGRRPITDFVITRSAAYVDQV